MVKVLVEVIFAGACVVGWTVLVAYCCFRAGMRAAIVNNLTAFFERIGEDAQAFRAGESSGRHARRYASHRDWPVQASRNAAADTTVLQAIDIKPHMSDTDPRGFLSVVK